MPKKITFFLFMVLLKNCDLQRNWELNFQCIIFYHQSYHQCQLPFISVSRSHSTHPACHLDRHNFQFCCCSSDLRFYWWLHGSSLYYNLFFTPLMYPMLLVSAHPAPPVASYSSTSSYSLPISSFLCLLHILWNKSDLDIPSILHCILSSYSAYHR